MYLSTVSLEHHHIQDWMTALYTVAVPMRRRRKRRWRRRRRRRRRRRSRRRK